MNHELIIIVDLGASFSQSIAKKVRENNVYCEVLPCEKDFNFIITKNPKGFIFAGNGNKANEYIMNNDFVNNKIPFISISNLNDCDILLKKFLFEDCNLKADWLIKDFVNDQILQLKNKIGNKKAICAISGGVDSTVSAVLVKKAIGDNLICVFVDHGLMRLNEAIEVMAEYKKLGLNVIHIEAEERFLNKLKNITEPETKRKIIGEEFIRIFEEEAKKLDNIDFLIQGTIYPDIIESGTDSSKLVKSHHNVGGLPDIISFEEIIEPLRDLFKDEVRQVGVFLEIDENLVYRQPFPGPGLGVRIIGDLTKEKLDILRQADYIYRDEIKKANLHRDIWQYFAILTGIKSVGVKNDERTYGYTIALRAVNSIDAMSAESFNIPYDILNKISNRVTTEVKEVNRIVFDITNKPPSTIEWE